MPAADPRRRSGSPPPRGAARREAERRRSWVMLACAVVLSMAILVAWFPFSSLVAQHGQISAASTELAGLKAQDRALAIEKAKLSSPSEVAKLAREQYQLVEPGQRLVQVLPPAGTSTQVGAGQAPYPGDPGRSPLVRPSAIALLPSGSVPQAASRVVHRSDRASGSPSLMNRILQTLEFWHR